ncbi:MAG: hypothetical protein E6J42_11165 [Chloroflexi bacterium]|nr:MAG: hypothetical protein E6J42_11165 [Chloroflexota bacterium]
MSCEALWQVVHDLKRPSKEAHESYLALIAPDLVTPEEANAIDDARQRCDEADEALGRAIAAALEAHH